MPQKISWMPCICGPAREAAERGRGHGHATLRCGRCHEEDQRDCRFYEPPHDIGNQPITGWTIQPDT
jgi:hypothetical protein